MSVRQLATLLLLAAPLLLAAKGRNKPAPPPPPPVTAVAQPPAPPPGPPPPTPPLSGPGPNGSDAGAPLLMPPPNTTDLKVFARDRIRYTLEVDASGLTLLDAAHARHLQEKLAADPRWRVTRWEGVVLALQRVAEGAGWTLPASGYHSSSGRQWRVALRFGDRRPGDSWLNPELTVHAAPSPSQVDGVGWPLTPSQWTSALVIEGGAGALEVHELAPTLDLQQTALAIRDVPPTVRALATGGIVPGPPLRGEPVRGPASLSLGERGSEWELRGRLNPGAAGWTWARVLDAAQRPVAEDRVGPATLEQIGWSTEADARYFFGARLAAPGPLPHGGTVEAWFQPEAGGTPQKIGSAPIP